MSEPGVRVPDERLDEPEHEIREALENMVPADMHVGRELGDGALAALEALVADLRAARADNQRLRQARDFYVQMLRDASEYLCEPVAHDALCGCNKPGDEGTCIFAGWLRESLAEEPVRDRATAGEFEKALLEVKKYASDPFLGPEVALRACLLAANEALGYPGPEPSPLRDAARAVIREMRSPRSPVPDLDANRPSESLFEKPTRKEAQHGA